MNGNRGQEHEDLGFMRLSRRDQSVARRPKAARRLSKSPKKSAAPNGVWRRRNKHWSW